jgi:hypothetical protein
MVMMELATREGPKPERLITISDSRIKREYVLRNYSFASVLRESPRRQKITTLADSNPGFVQAYSIQISP